MESALFHLQHNKQRQTLVFRSKHKNTSASCSSLPLWRKEKNHLSQVSWYQPKFHSFLFPNILVSIMFILKSIVVLFKRYVFFLLFWWNGVQWVMPNADLVKERKTNNWGKQPASRCIKNFLSINTWTLWSELSKMLVVYWLFLACHACAATTRMVGMVLLHLSIGLGYEWSCNLSVWGHIHTYRSARIWGSPSISARMVSKLLWLPSWEASLGCLCGSGSSSPLCCYLYHGHQVPKLPTQIETIWIS